MSSENTLTGRLGKHMVETTLVARIAQFTVNPKLASVNEWGDSDSGGYTNRSAGRQDNTFTDEGKFDTDNEVWDLFQPDDNVASSLWINASLYWDFPRSLCSDFSLTVNVDSEDVVGWSASWGADGIFYRPGEAGATSRTLP